MIWVNHITAIVREQVYKTSVVDHYSSSYSNILAIKDRRRKKTFGDDTILMFMDPTKAY